jgi:uroporphyrinogen-III synthase
MEIGKTCFCIGKETARIVEETFSQAKIVIALSPTQEGVIECIKNYAQKEPLKTLFWPRSKAARQLLSLALSPIRIIECVLYAPLPVTQSYSFNEVDEILFTCPSSVNAFFSCIDRKEIEYISLSAIGPVTQRRLLAFSS